MKAYLWYNIETVSDNYHPGDSVLIEAPNLERARLIAGFLKEIYYPKDRTSVPEMIPMVGVDREPDAVFESSNTEEKVWIFPDAGCC